MDIESVLNVLKSPKCPYNNDIHVYSVAPDDSSFETTSWINDPNRNSNKTATKKTNLIQKTTTAKKIFMPRKHFRTMSAGAEPDPKQVSPMPRETYITKNSPVPTTNYQKAVQRQKRRSVGSTQDLMREINSTPLIFSKSAKKSISSEKQKDSDLRNQKYTDLGNLNEVKAIFNDFKLKTKKIIVQPKPSFSHEFVLRMIFCSWKAWAVNRKYESVEFK